MRNRQNARDAGLKRYLGKVCRSHPEMSGIRYACSGRCVACDNNKARLYFLANKERENARSRAWHAANKVARNLKKAQYMRDNAGRWRVNAARRRSEDLNYRIRRSLQARLNRALHRGQKGGSLIGDLGCTLDFAREHLEAQFRDGMSWDNWGVVWQIDHRCPLASFDLTCRDQFLVAANHANLQPLLISEHREKTVRERQLHARVDNVIPIGSVEPEEAAHAQL